MLEGFVTDITERKRTDEALREQRGKYRSLIENLTQSVFLKDRELRFVAVNRPFCAAQRRSEADIIGKTDFDFFPADMAEQFRADDRIRASPRDAASSAKSKRSSPASRAPCRW